MQANIGMSSLFEGERLECETIAKVHKKEGDEDENEAEGERCNPENDVSIRMLAVG